MKLTELLYPFAFLPVCLLLYYVLPKRCRNAALLAASLLFFAWGTPEYLVLLVLLMVIVIQEPSFLSLTNFSNILTQSSVRVIIALGVAGIIITQGTDLSAGRQVGLAALIAAMCMPWLPNGASSIDTRPVLVSSGEAGTS